MDENLLTQFDESVRRQCRGVGRTVERLDRVTRVTGQTPYQLDNMILWNDLDETNADREIDAQMAHFVALGHNFQWFTYGHDHPRDLVERLLARGFERESEEQVVLNRSADVEDFQPPAGVELRTLDDPAQVADTIAVGNAVWGNGHDEFLTRWLTELVRDHRDESSVIVAYHGEQPVGTGWTVQWRGLAFAPLFGGSVLEEWRGQGIYRAMVAARAKAAVARGIEWCIVDAGEKSFPILDRLGFKLLTNRVRLGWTSDKPDRA